MTPPRSPPTAARSGPLRNARYVRLLLAGIASQSGSAIASVALLWLAYTTTGSALVVAAVGVATLAGSIGLSLPAGVWVDRYDRRRLMILSDLVRAAAMAGLAATIALAGFYLPAVLALTVVVSGASVVFQPAEQTLVPSLVAPDELADANALLRSSREVVALVGASVGGLLLVVLHGELSFAYNALTFVASAALVYAVRPLGAVAPPEVARAARPAMGEEIAAGFRWLVRKAPGLFELSLSALAMNFFYTLVTAFLVIYVATQLHLSAAGYGLFLAVGAAGSIGGSLLVARTRAVARVGRSWILGYGLATGATTVVLALTHDLPLALLFFAVGATTGSLAGNAWLTAAQSIVPTELQGRYFALDGLLSWIALPAAEIVGGLVIGRWGIATAFLVAGVGLVASGAVALLGRSLWRLRGDVPLPR